MVFAAPAEVIVTKPVQVSSLVTTAGFTLTVMGTLIVPWVTPLAGLKLR